jgi:hypothetical protein
VASQLFFYETKGSNASYGIKTCLDWFRRAGKRLTDWPSADRTVQGLVSAGDENRIAESTHRQKDLARTFSSIRDRQSATGTRQAQRGCQDSFKALVPDFREF